MWISTAKQLPLNGQKVLVYRFKHGVELGVLKSNVRAEGLEVVWDVTGEGEGKDIGFWMPLPGFFVDGQNKDWVSFDAEMPPEGKKVIVYTEIGVVLGRLSVIVQAGNERDVFWDIWDIPTVTDGEYGLTHWMALPKPPVHVNTQKDKNDDNGGAITQKLLELCNIGKVAMFALFFVGILFISGLSAENDVKRPPQAAASQVGGCCVAATRDTVYVRDTVVVGEGSGGYIKPVHPIYKLTDDDKKMLEVWRNKDE